MDSQNENVSTNDLTSTMGSVLSTSNEPNKKSPTVDVPTSSSDKSDANKIDPNSCEKSPEDTISSSSDIMDCTSNKSTVEKLGISQEKKSYSNSELDNEVDIFANECNLSQMPTERITENVEDIVSDLENLLGEPSDFSMPTSNKVLVKDTDIFDDLTFKESTASSNILNMIPLEEKSNVLSSDKESTLIGKNIIGNKCEDIVMVQKSDLENSNVNNVSSGTDRSQRPEDIESNNPLSKCDTLITTVDHMDVDPHCRILDNDGIVKHDQNISEISSNITLDITDIQKDEKNNLSKENFKSKVCHFTKEDPDLGKNNILTEKLKILDNNESSKIIGNKIACDVQNIGKNNENVIESNTIQISIMDNEILFKKPTELESSSNKNQSKNLKQNDNSLETSSNDPNNEATNIQPDITNKTQSELNVYTELGLEETSGKCDFKAKESQSFVSETKIFESTLDPPDKLTVHNKTCSDNKSKEDPNNVTNQEICIPTIASTDSDNEKQELKIGVIEEGIPSVELEIKMGESNSNSMNNMVIEDIIDGSNTFMEVCSDNITKENILIKSNITDTTGEHNTSSKVLQSTEETNKNNKELHVDNIEKISKSSFHQLGDTSICTNLDETDIIMKNSENTNKKTDNEERSHVIEANTFPLATAEVIFANQDDEMKGGKEKVILLDEEENNSCPKDSKDTIISRLDSKETKENEIIIEKTSPTENEPTISIGYLCDVSNEESLKLKNVLPMEVCSDLDKKEIICYEKDIDKEIKPELNLPTETNLDLEETNREMVDQEKEKVCLDYVQTISDSSVSIVEKICENTKGVTLMEIASDDISDKTTIVKLDSKEDILEIEKNNTQEENTDLDINIHLNNKVQLPENILSYTDNNESKNLDVNEGNSVKTFSESTHIESTKVESDSENTKTQELNNKNAAISCLTKETKEEGKIKNLKNVTHFDNISSIDVPCEKTVDLKSEKPSLENEIVLKINENILPSEVSQMDSKHSENSDTLPQEESSEIETIEKIEKSVDGVKLSSEVLPNIKSQCFELICMDSKLQEDSSNHENVDSGSTVETKIKDEPIICIKPKTFNVIPEADKSKLTHTADTSLNKYSQEFQQTEESLSSNTLLNKPILEASTNSSEISTDKHSLTKDENLPIECVDQIKKVNIYNENIENVETIKYNLKEEKHKPEDKINFEVGSDNILINTAIEMSQEKENLNTTEIKEALKLPEESIKLVTEQKIDNLSQEDEPMDVDEQDLSSNVYDFKEITPKICDKKMEVNESCLNDVMKMEYITAIAENTELKSEENTISGNNLNISHKGTDSDTIEDAKTKDKVIQENKIYPSEFMQNADIVNENSSKGIGITHKEEKIIYEENTDVDIVENKEIVQDFKDGYEMKGTEIISINNENLENMEIESNFNTENQISNLEISSEKENDQINEEDELVKAAFEATLNSSQSENMNIILESSNLEEESKEEPGKDINDELALIQAAQDSQQRQMEENTSVNNELKSTSEVLSLSENKSEVICKLISEEDFKEKPVESDEITLIKAAQESQMREIDDNVSCSPKPDENKGENIIKECTLSSESDLLDGLKKPLNIVIENVQLPTVSIKEAQSTTNEEVEDNDLSSEVKPEYSSKISQSQELKLTITKNKNEEETSSILKICESQSMHSKETNSPISLLEREESPIPKLIIKQSQCSPKLLSPLKITIKPLLKPEDQQKSSPKLIIKPLVKPEDDIKIDERHLSPKITIKHIPKPSDEGERSHSPKITIKPIIKPPELSTKIKIKPIIKPDDTKDDLEGDEEMKQRIVLKINKGNISQKEAKKVEDNEKLATIKVKLSKEGGCAHIVNKDEEKNLKRSNDAVSVELDVKKQKLETPENNISNITDNSDIRKIETVVVSNISAVTPTLNPVPTPKKRGRPRKVPLEVREDFKETPVPVESTSGRPKRSCRGPSVKTTLGIKPRKPRGTSIRGRPPGRGSRVRGGKVEKPLKKERIKESKLKLLKEAALTARVTESLENQDIDMKLVDNTIVIEETLNENLDNIKEEIKVQSFGLEETLVKSDVVMYEEETRMSAETNSRAQTPAKQVLVPIPQDIEESQSSTATSESIKVQRRHRLEFEQEPGGSIISADQLAEYYWANGGPYMLQEQVAQFLGIKSFKRKYPGIQRRPVDMQERDFIRESGLVTENMCDLGLTAVNSSDILDIMYTDFQHKYEEYCKHQRDRLTKDITNKQKALSLAASQEKTKFDIMQQAVESAAHWNSSFNKTRKDQRKACMDLQTMTINFPKGKCKQINKPKLGNYPIALVPGQYTDYYKPFTPTELNNLPLNTMLYDPINIHHDEDSQSDGSGSESESSSSGSDSSDTDSSDDDCKLCTTTPLPKKAVV